MSLAFCDKGPLGILFCVPIYEYECQDCSHRFSLLLGMIVKPDEEQCPKCGGQKIAKLVSRFRRLRSEDERIDEAADRIERLGEPESISEMRAMVREIGEAADEDVADDLEEMMESDLEEAESA